MQKKLWAGFNQHIGEDITDIFVLADYFKIRVTGKEIDFDLYMVHLI